MQQNNRGGLKMDAKAQQQLYEIKQELQSIINELDDIGTGIKRDFKGIGNDICASRIAEVESQYRNVKKKLNKIDTSKVTEEYAAKHSGGGRQG